MEQNEIAKQTQGVPLLPTLLALLMVFSLVITACQTGANEVELEERTEGVEVLVDVPAGVEPPAEDDPTDLTDGDLDLESELSEEELDTLPYGAAETGADATADSDEVPPPGL